MGEKFCIGLPRHFIFNTLNSVIALCRTDSEKATHVIAALAQCMHFSSMTESVIQLEEECDFIESYLTIQAVRFTPDLISSSSYTQDLNELRINRFELFNFIDSTLKSVFAKERQKTHFHWSLTIENESLRAEIFINENQFSEKIIILKNLKSINSKI